jgi:hypothetical protein
MGYVAQKRFSRYWQLHRLYSFRQLWRRLVAAEAVATEGGFDGGAFHGGGFHGRGFKPGLALGAIGTGLGYGLHRPYDNGNYGYYGYPYVYYPNGYTNSYDDNEDCYVVRRRVHTTHGGACTPFRCAVDESC